MICELDGITPQIHPTAWVAPTAVLIGRVVVEAGANIWFGVVIRGDNEEIRIGAGSNVQENCVLHTDIGAPLTIGANCTIGHKAMLHGCTIEEGSLIGMGATVLNHAVIGAGSLVGAAALVTEGKAIPPGSLVMGAPGKVVRALDDAAKARLIASATGYQANARRFSAGMKIVG
jgi:carbonic anhydrase/acetyltransferase-like protein (isoleucine patch superfamily)